MYIKENCFNIIRLLAALQVFFGHSLVHLGLSNDMKFSLLGIFQGVPIFFILSGFLIWNSLGKIEKFGNYVKRRLFRLYPELWVGVGVSILSILWLYHDHIIWKEFILFIFAQASVFQFWTPDSLRGFGVGVPNGSLWTIGVMVQSYLVIWCIYKRLHKSSKLKWSMYLVFGMIFNILPPFLEDIFPAIIYKLFTQTFFPYIWMFVFGAMLCEYFENIIMLLKRRWIIFFMISAVFSITGWDLGIYGTLKVSFLGLAIIGFAYQYPKIQLKYDFSYGFYIYHMIVINVLIQLGYIGNMKYMFIALVSSGILAIISYFTVGNIGRILKKTLIN